MKDQSLLSACKVTWKQIRSMWGNGWNHLGDEIKRAIITERVFHIFTGRASIEGYTVKPEEMSRYLNAMLDFCGLMEKEGE